MADPLSVRPFTRRSALALFGAACASPALASLDGCASVGTGPGRDATPDVPAATDARAALDAPAPDVPAAAADAGVRIEAGADTPDAPPDAARVTKVVGRYADLNLQAHAVYSIDMALRDYPQWTAHPDSGEMRVHEVGTWWDGGDALRTHPPTVNDRGSGIGAITDLWRGGTFAIRELNLRFEWQAGPEYCSRTNDSLPKFVIAHSSRRLARDAPTVDRPMMYLREVTSSDNPRFNRVDTLAVCPAQGTTQWWDEGTYSERSTYWPAQIQPVYLADTPATFLGNPVIGAGQIITFEMRMLAIATPQHPRGLIAVRMYLRDGRMFERGCPWNLDTNATLGVSYLNEIQMFGGGYYNRANAFHPNKFTRIGGHITLAANYGGWLGPRPGFVMA